MMNEYNPDGKDIRFIDSHYKDLFHIPDGGCIQIDYPNETVVKPCKFIDEYHTQIGNNVFHICQFAEMMERNGNAVIPLRSSLPVQCFSVLPSSGELILLTRGEKGYSPCYDFSTPDAQQNREFADDRNVKNGVTKAQEAAMLAGSMFGWQTPAADPRNYDEQGQPIKPRQKDRGEAR